MLFLIFLLDLLCHCCSLSLLFCLVEAPQTGSGDNQAKLLLADNTFAVAMPNQRQFARSLASAGSVAHLEEDPDKKDKTVSVPESLRDELFCPLCHSPFVNAVMPPCCFATFCDACIRKYLSAIEQPQCPMCQSAECTISVLKPNLDFQKAVDDYLDANPLQVSAAFTTQAPPAVRPLPFLPSAVPAVSGMSFYLSVV